MAPSSGTCTPIVDGGRPRSITAQHSFRGLIARCCTARLLITAAIIVAVIEQDCPAATVDECPLIYEIVAEVAVEVLPQPIQQFFGAHLQEVQRSATEFISLAATNGKPSRKERRHYVMLDVGASNSDAAGRRKAARKFPRNRTKARRLYRSHAQKEGGELPWILLEHYDSLTRAMERPSKSAILREAGTLLHLCVDAAIPFNTTVARDGTQSGNLFWPADAKSSAYASPRHTARHRWQCEMAKRLRQRLGFEVRVWPGRLRQVPDPAGVVFQLLLDSHAQAEELLEIDRLLTKTLGITDAHSFESASEEYYAGLTLRSASILESRLEAAALLGAELIGSAWASAGRPLLPTSETTVTGNTAAQSSTGAEADSVVGSRNSRIFHLSGCSHAKRITPANLVSFPSAAEALKRGRRACRTCKPGGPGS